MKKAFILIYFFAFICSYSNTLISQTIEKSVILETIDGKDYYLHFVKDGETLFAIARTYDLTVNDIFKVNPESRQGISSGDILKIPYKDENTKSLTDEATIESSEFFYHIVKKQETLYGISKKYGTSIEELLKLNPQMGDYPKEGETLKIPVAKEDDTTTDSSWEGSSTQHTVEPGETLYGIARQYGVTIGEIQNANPGLSDVIKTGSILIIPNQYIVVEEEISETGEEIEDGFIIHEVIAGETLYSIASSYAVSIDTLRKYNSGLTSYLSIGQVISVPPANPDSEYIVHVSSKKQTLEGISDLYNVDVDEVEKINPGVRKKTKKGQFIKIPVEPREVEEVVNIAEETTENNGEGSDCFRSNIHQNSTFNVALMLPFYLEEMDGIDLENKKDIESLVNFVSFRFMDFYAGFKMAADSMQKMGMKLNVFVYDVDNKPEKTNKVLYSSELSSMDLIIGPLFAKSFQQIADFAKTYHIPIINPLSKREEIVYGNPFVYKIKPSEEKQIDQLVNYIEKKYPESNIVLVRHNKYKYQSQISYMRNFLNKKRPSHVYLSNSHLYDILSEDKEKNSLLTENKLLEKEFIAENKEDSTYFSNLVKEVLYVEDSTVGLRMNLSRVRNNIVIALSNEIVFSKDLLSQLNKLEMDRDIILFGLPEWNKFNDLETSHLLNLNFHCFSPDVVDFEKDRIKSWIEDYRTLYHSEPSTNNYAFDGFDVGWYFLNALYNYGRNFGECLPYLSVPLLQSRFEFESSPYNGYQNTFWTLGEYEDYQFKKVDGVIE